MFRPRLYHLETEEELWEYFQENAGYDSVNDWYVCAGCVALTPALLFKKLKEEWKADYAEWLKTVEYLV